MNSLLESLKSAFAPPDRRPIYEWAREHVNIPDGCGYKKTGPFEPEPYHIRPFDAIADDSVRVVHIRKGVQAAGSVIGDMAILHTTVNKPQNIYWTFPTIDQYKDYAERRGMRLLRKACRLVGEKIRGVEAVNRHDVKKFEILFGDMYVCLQAANEGSLQSHSVPMLINEELWQWRPGMKQHAYARTTAYDWRAKIINISQAGEPNSDEDQEFMAGTQELWDVPCLHCNRFHDMPWSVRAPDHSATGKPVYAGISWDTNEKTRPGGVWNFDEVRQTARIVCPHCLNATPDEMLERRRMKMLGRYRVTNQNASKSQVSVHWPSWAHEDVSLGLMVEEFLRAKDQEKIGNLVPLREWWQKRAARSFDPAQHRHYDLAPAVSLESDVLSLESGDPGHKTQDTRRKFWAKQDFICGVFDIQSDHCWGMVIAWSKTGEDMILWFGGGAEPERTRTEPLWDDRDIAAIQERFGIEPQCMFLDCRHDPGRVYKWCASHFKEVTTRHGRKATVCWNAVQGASSQNFNYTIPATKTRPARNLRLPYSWPPVKIDPCTRLRPGDDKIRELLRGKLINRINFAKPWIDPIAFERREMLLRGDTSFMKKGDWNEELSKQLQGEQPALVQPKFGQAMTKSKYVGANHGLDLYRISIMFACIVEIIGDKRG